MTVNDKLIAAMRGGKDLKVTVQDPSKKPIEMSLPLLGFGLAYRQGEVGPVRYPPPVSRRARRSPTAMLPRTDPFRHPSRRAMSSDVLLEHHHVAVAADAEIGKPDEIGAHAGLTQVGDGAVVVGCVIGRLRH